MNGKRLSPPHSLYSLSFSDSGPFHSFQFFYPSPPAYLSTTTTVPNFSSLKSMGKITYATPRRPHRSGGGGGGGGREDCWSEAETETLIEAWGDRYIKLNKGNLSQKDWKEVTDAVNVHLNGIKPPRTDIQCKNRIYTLKKKFKLETAKPKPSK